MTPANQIPQTSVHVPHALSTNPHKIYIFKEKYRQPSLSLLYHIPLRDDKVCESTISNLDCNTGMITFCVHMWLFLIIWPLVLRRAHPILGF